jgi:hypothetical protein
MDDSAVPREVIMPIGFAPNGTHSIIGYGFTWGWLREATNAMRGPLTTHTGSLGRSTG